MIKLTNRERMFRILRGGDLDKIPFVHQTGLAGDDNEMWQVLGRDNMALSKWSRVHGTVNETCKRTREEILINGKEGFRDTIYTPIGSIYQDEIKLPGYSATGCVKHFVEDEKDLRILSEYYRGFKVFADPGYFINDMKKLGDDGLAYAIIARTPYQVLVTEYANIEELAYIMADYPEVFEECCEVLGNHLRDIFKAVKTASDEIDIPLVDIPENITAPLIGKKIYKEYCMPYYDEFKEIMGEKNTLLFTHLDGELKGIWEEVKNANIDGIDSFTPVPTGDTSVKEALEAFENRRLMCNFPSSVHVADKDVIYNTAMEILKEGGLSGRMWIAISENVPENRWKVSFPEIVRAINDFYK